MSTSGIKWITWGFNFHTLHVDLQQKRRGNVPFSHQCVWRSISGIKQKTTSLTLGSGGGAYGSKKNLGLSIQITGLFFWYLSVLFVRIVTNFQETFAQTTMKKHEIFYWYTYFFVDYQNNLDFLDKNNFPTFIFFKVSCSYDKAGCLADLDEFQGVFRRWMGFGFGCGIQIKLARLQGP